MSKDKNKEAFPCVSGCSTEEGSYLQTGIELRDYFAAKAMQALLTTVDSRSKNADLAGYDVNEYVATYSYEVADAMMKERDKPV